MARPRIAWCVLIPAFAYFLLWAWQLRREFPWRDEAASLLFAELGPRQMWRATAYVDRVMMPYYLLLHLAPAGHRLLVGRLVSVAAVALAIACTSAAARRLFGDAAAWASGLFLVSNPAIGDLAFEARSYGLLVLGSAASAWFLVRLRHPGGERGPDRQRGRLPDAVGYAVSVVVATLMHVLWLPMLGAHLVFLAASRARRRTWLQAGAGWLAAVLAGGGLYAVAGHETSQIGDVPRPSVKDLVKLVLQESGTVERVVPGPILVCAVAGAVLAWSLLHVLRRPRRSAEPFRSPDLAGLALAASLWLVQPVALFLVSVVANPVLKQSYLSPATLGVALLVGAATDVLAPGARGRRLLAVVLVVAAALSSLSCIPHDRPSTSTRDGFPELAGALRQEARPGDVLAVWTATAETGYSGVVALGLDDDALWHQSEQALFGAPGGLTAVRIDSTTPWTTTPVADADVWSSPRVVLVHLVYHDPPMPAQCRLARQLGSWDDTEVSVVSCQAA